MNVVSKCQMRRQQRCTWVRQGYIGEDGKEFRRMLERGTKSLWWNFEARPPLRVPVLAMPVEFLLRLGP